MNETKIAQLGENAEKIMSKLWSKMGEDGKPVETPEQTMRRVAHHIAAGEKNKADRAKWEEIFYQAMTACELTPNSPAYSGAGKDDGQLSACFVLPVDDSMIDIFNSMKFAALIHKSGGGTGFSFDTLRESGSLVKSQNTESSGPISFMRVYDEATEAIKQGGRRRGANMGCMRVDHPDIEEFIMCKDRCDACESCGSRPPFSNFNLSVKLTNSFMDAVARDEEYELISPVTGPTGKWVSAAKVFDMIATQAWKNGEPGVLFIDEINRCNPTPGLGDMISTNPCGEQPLLPYEACVLVQVNLVEHLKDGDFDFEKLKKTIRTAIRFGDDLINVNKYPLKEFEEGVGKTRKIGLGIMGWADCLIEFEMSYASAKALELARRLQEFINREAFIASCELGEERGPFPAIDESIWARFGEGTRPRNATRTTIAPTGTTSRVFDVSSGIEPLFGLSYVKNVVATGKTMTFFNEKFEKAILEELNPADAKKVFAIVEKTGSVQGIDIVPGRIKDIFKVSTDISPEWHIKMQAAFQEFTDNAVSKTIILPNSATVEDVKQAYLLAHKMGLKGITVYRNDSRVHQAMTIGDGKKAAVEVVTESPVKKRPDRLEGVERRIQTGCGKIYVFCGFDEDHRLIEIIASLGKSGGCTSAYMQTIGKLASIALRTGTPPEEIVDMLSDISCSVSAFTPYGKVSSCADAIAKVIRLETGMLKEEVTENDGGSEIQQIASGNGQCPDCHSPLIPDSGCVMCPSCGYSKCG